MSKLNHSQNLAVCRRAGCFLAVLILADLLSSTAKAQSLKTLYAFTGTSANALGVYTSSDGAQPYAGLTLSGNTLYGTASAGGTAGNGTVFAVNLDGTGFTNLYNFSATPPYPLPQTNIDGASPSGGLVLFGNALYGTTFAGGVWTNGSVFTLQTDGTGFTNLHSFTGHQTYANEGADPAGGLILSGNTLYGTTAYGGSWGAGTVFAGNTNGTGFGTLHSFTTTYPSTTNNDGADPAGGLILSGNTLYGTAQVGGNWGSGTIFALNTDGTGFTNLHSFTALPAFFSGTNSDGAGPNAGLVLSSKTLYGTAYYGGSWGRGTVFKLNADGTRFATLHSFSQVINGTNSDGGSPVGRLILSGNTLYGTAKEGGNWGSGTIFALNTDGTGFTNLHNFAGYPTDGANPSGLMILLGNALYGTTAYGGSYDNGTIFSISLPPPLTITPAGSNLKLSWPTDFTGFFLQDTVTIGPSARWISTPIPFPPIILNGQYVVTIPTPPTTQHYYRLSQ